MNEGSAESKAPDLVRQYHARTKRVEVLGQLACRLAPAIGERSDYGPEIECSAKLTEARDRMLVTIFDAIDRIAAKDE